MFGRVRTFGGSDTEDLVGERLRSILAAANPRPGWVPQRIGKSAESPRDEVTEATEERESSDVRVRWEPSRPGVLAMLVAAVLAAAVAAGVTWWSRPSPPDQQLFSASSASAAEVLSSPDHPEGQSEPAAQASEQLVVSVIGQVRQPGLVTVADGARVADAISAAGGALPEADLSTINLARLVVDGEQIAVGIPGSSLPGGGDPAATSDGLVNLNTASAAELEGLPGIGPVLAQRIIDFREDSGGFTAVEELREVSGIGPTLYEEIVELVTV